jgi:DNA-binding NtrC family response regulator
MLKKSESASTHAKKSFVETLRWLFSVDPKLEKLPVKKSERRSSQPVKVDGDVVKTFMLASNDREKFRNLSQFLKTFDADTLAIRSIQEATSIYQRRAREKTMLIVDLDTLTDGDRKYELLFDLRAHYPGLPVMLISESFARDDFSIERLPLCDVSLRAPTSFKSFEAGIKDALENNGAWQKRNSELFHSEHTKH